MIPSDPDMPTELLRDSEQAELMPKLEASDNPLDAHPSNVHTHTRTGENRTRIWVWAIAPLILHFLSVVALTLVIKFWIDGYDFNLQSRHALSEFTPLQSDITTAVSSSIAISRLFATTWSAAMIWRCIFLLMGRDGISLEQIDRLLSWQVHLYPRSQSIGLFVSIVLLAAFPCQLSGPILTGSITWSSSHVTTGRQIVDEIGSGDTFGLGARAPVARNLSEIAEPSSGPPLAASLAEIAWQGSPEDDRLMKRVVRRVISLPINSTLTNLTLPYFAITKLEWVKDPNTELPPELIQAVSNSTEWNPFFPIYVPGTFALIPDTGFGAVNPPSPYTGILEETRAVFGYYNKVKNSCNTSSLFGDMPPNIRFYSLRDTRPCYIYGHVTYVAGGAECRSCRISSWLTVQNDTALTVKPTMETVYATSMMSKAGLLMVHQNVSLPGTFNNLDGYVTQLLARSYGASWTYLTEWYTMGGGFAADAKVAVPTSRADVLWWRVWLWLFINLLFTLSGVLVLFIHRISNQPLIGNPLMAALLLDTTDVLHRCDRAFCDFSTLVEADRGIGYLRLRRNAVDAHRRVEIVHDRNLDES